MWNDWKWQINNRITTYQQLSRIISLKEYETPENFKESKPSFSITPYYASLLVNDDPLQSIRKAVIPSIYETAYNSCESEDPLDEDTFRQIPGIIHRYPDKVVFLATDFCAVKCRYCTRSRLVAEDAGKNINEGCWKEAISYISQNPGIRDVLVSGGDALTLSDEKLDWLLGSLRDIKHVEFLRIGTKAPVVLPQRITPDLLNVLKKYHPLWMSIHFTHPDELTPDVSEACCRIADAGIPMGSQTVLLKGVNDNTETLKKLFCGLLKIRVKPYYLYQCDPILGSAHFRTPIEQGLEVIEALVGHTTGYAVPTYVIDTPQGGKVPLLPDYVAGRDNGGLFLRGYNGKVSYYTGGQAEK
jgi:lysine 2,3-aminomutase